MRRTLYVLVSLIVAGALFTTAPTASAVPDRDCSDFDTQAQAQNFFLDHGGPNSDPHQLDADGDGIACESNPCPCSTNTGGGGGGGGGNGDGGGGGGGDETPVKRQRAKVIRVVDGDTIEVNLRPGPKVMVRLIGIDTPEVFGGTECGGEAASKKTKKILPRGTIVRMVSDPTQDLKDRYDRLLRYVAKRTLDVNRRLVRSGHARVYVYQNNPFQRTKSYRIAENYAKKNDLGIWGNC